MSWVSLALSVGGSRPGHGADSCEVVEGAWTAECRERIAGIILPCTTGILCFS